MEKLLLNSILLATIAIPLLAAREKQRRAGFRFVVGAMVLFEVFYVGYLLYFYHPVLRAQQIEQPLRP